MLRYSRDHLPVDDTLLASKYSFYLQAVILFIHEACFSFIGIYTAGYVFRLQFLRFFEVSRTFDCILGRILVFWIADCIIDSLG